MSRRDVMAGALGLGAAVVVVGLSGLSVYVRAREPGWREDGTRRGAGTQLAVDVGLWWGGHGWIVGLMAAQLLLGAGIWRGVRRAVARHAQSGAARDFAEHRTGPGRDGRAEPDSALVRGGNG